MGKTYKLALALLYLLQLVIVFHEQVLHLFEQVAHLNASQTAEQVVRPQGFLDKLKHAAADKGRDADAVRIAPPTERHAVLATAILATKDEKHLPDHPHEEKNNDGKRGRRRRVAEFLVENLYRRYKRIADPTSETSLSHRVPRFIAYPETALRQQAA